MQKKHSDLYKRIIAGIIIWSLLFFVFIVLASEGGVKCQNQYRNNYLIDSESTFSQVLEINRSYENGAIEQETFYYGDGLLYETRNREELLVYHYDHLGSTVLLTNEAGKKQNTFAYGTYGELECSADENAGDLNIRFLYNGKLGVVTDENGLYYMRARYYNPDIKRFLNRDILTGSIANSKSLNQYAYVEGNPVSYTDPFGLSPYANALNRLNGVKNAISSGVDRFIHDSEFRSRIIHSSLGIVGTVVNGANYINALLYAVEGNGKEAAKSLMFGLAGSSVQKIKGFTGFFLKDTKAAATTASVMKAVGTGYALDLAATDFANKAEAMLEKYWIDGADITWDTAAEALDLTCSGLQMGNYINQFYRSGSDALGEVKDLLKDSKAGAYLNNIWNDNRGMIDAEVLCGGSDAVSWSNHGYKHFPNKNQSWKDIVKSTKSGPAKYSLDIQDIEAFERAAWENGIPVTNGKNWRVNKYDTTIGAVNGKETVYVRIENSSNTIHGHPISESEYNKLLKEH